MAGNSEKPTTYQEWFQQRYEFDERDGHQVLETPERSIERRLLFQHAYSDIIGNTIERCERGGGESSRTDTIVGIVKALVASSRKHTATIFELGCGNGSMLSSLARENYNVYGIDTSEMLIAQAKESLLPFAKTSHVQRGDVLDYLPPVKFDVIVMDHVDEHLIPDETPDIFAKCYEMLAQEGYLVITPHRCSESDDANEYFSSFASRADEWHLRDMNEYLVDAGFQDVWGFPFQPRLLGRCHLTSRSSEDGIRKDMAVERVVQHDQPAKSLKLDRLLAQIPIALAFPAVVVGIKRVSGTSCRVSLSM